MNASPRPLAKNPSRPAQRSRAGFGWLERLFARRFFQPIAFPEQAERTLRELSDKGEVVHVMRTAGILNFLFLAWTLLRLGLPALRTAFGLGWTFLGPYRLLKQEGSAASRLEQSLGAGGAALVFLRERTGYMPRLEAREDPFFALLQRARVSPRPIYLVPELFLWRTRARNVVPNLRDLLFGDPEAPGMLVTAWGFLLHYRNAFFRVGEPIELTRLVRENPEVPDSVLVAKVRGALTQHLGRETRAIVGPPRKAPERIIEKTLRNRALREVLAEIAQDRGVEPAAVRREARGHLEKIAARQSPLVIAACKPVLTWVFTHLHEGVEVDEEGLLRALSIARKGPVVYCPSHKSHLDYLVMAWVFASRGITPPLVAAGANLSFWPLGTLFSRGGAYFLRRSFRGDRVYAATFRAYIRQLLLEGYAQEFFIEGGRSRTGKLLPPRLGMVSFQVDAFLDGVQEDVNIVPVAIDYETVLEAKSYARELAGGEKKPESLRSLLTTPKVLAHRYGRIYLSFAEPISLRQFLASRGVDPAAVTPEQRRAATRALAHRITYGISQATTLTPAALVAAAILGTPQGATPRQAAAHVEYLRAVARSEKVRVSPVMEGASSDPSVPGPLNRVLRRFMEEGLIEPHAAGAETVYAAAPERRSSLSYYKNNLLNLVANRAIIASALLSFEGGTAPAQAHSERARLLGRLFKLELAYPAGVPFEEQLERTRAALVEERLVFLEGSRIRASSHPESRERLEFLRELLRDLLESYHLFAASLPRAREPIERKELLREALDGARLALREGRIRCPEAVSRPNLDNALSVWVDRGVLVSLDEGRRVQLAEACRGEEALASYAEELAPFLAG